MSAFALLLFIAMKIITIENVSFAYPSERFVEAALQHINMQVETGEFVAIVGHNGSGKSTLAKHVNAILLPDTGEVTVDGKNTKDEKVLWEIRQSAGMVFQNPDNQLVANIVEEDVAFGLENIGVPSPEIRKRVDEALLQVGMEEYAESETPSSLRRAKTARGDCRCNCPCARKS